MGGSAAHSPVLASLGQFFCSGQDMLQANTKNHIVIGNTDNQHVPTRYKIFHRLRVNTTYIVLVNKMMTLFVFR